MTPRRARIVFMAHTFMVGGAEEMVLNLIRHLPARFEPVVCCINEAGPIGEEIRRTGVPFHVLHLDPGIRRPWHVLGIARHLRAVQPDIVHTFLLTASLYGRLGAILAGVPIVIGTEVNIYEHKQPHHALAERLLMRGTDRVVVSAESVREPVAIRYGWATVPEVNLFNREGLPASPFRTDDYPLTTRDNK